MPTTIHIIAPVPDPAKRTRVAKQAKALKDRGHNVEFLGWERERGEAEALRNTSPDTDIAKRILLSGGGYGGKRTLLYYPLWALAVFWRVLFLPRDATLFCLGFETAGPALLASLFSRRRVIFDDADRLSMLFSFPAPVKSVIAAYERWASRRAAWHLIPGRTRYDWSHARMLVLRNTPASGDFGEAKALDTSQLFPAIGQGDEFVIYANGWVGETRGAPILLALMQRLAKEKQRFRLLLIGRGEGEAFDALAAREDVSFFEEMPQVQALAAYRVADLLFTYYDPAVPINRQAESNKWGDAVYFETPFVVNSEVETAQPFIDAGAAFACPYHDIDALTALLIRCAGQPELLANAGKNLRRFAEEYMPYDVALETILAEGAGAIEGNQGRGRN